MPDLVKISFAIPLYNEGEVIPYLKQALLELRESLSCRTHFILVNDGSFDSTGAQLDEFANLHEDVTVVHLSRNFGQQAAYSAALFYADGEATVLMDADLQDDPSVVLSFIQKFLEGFEVVYAIRESREEGAFLRVCYHCFYFIIQKITEFPLPRDAGDFCLVSARVVRELKELPEVHRYLRGMRAWVGYKQIGVSVARRPRKAGESKYTFKKLLRLASDGVFSFSLWPLRLAFIAGAGALLCAGLFICYTLLQKLLYDTVPSGFSATVTLAVFLSGIQMFLMGVLGEYVGRVLQQVKGRPNFVVDRVWSGVSRQEKSAG